MEVMLFSSRTRQIRTVDRLHSPDSGENFPVGVILHAFHLAQILRAHATVPKFESRLHSAHKGSMLPTTLWTHLNTHKHTHKHSTEQEQCSTA